MGRKGELLMSRVREAEQAIVDALNKVSALPRAPNFSDAEILLGDARRKLGENMEDNDAPMAT